MSKPLRYGLLVLALGAGWVLFGERLKPLLDRWAAPIEPAEYSEHWGHPDAAAQAVPESKRTERAEGPRREHISERVRRKVRADLDRGAARSDR